MTVLGPAMLHRLRGRSRRAILVRAERATDATAAVTARSTRARPRCAKRRSASLWTSTRRTPDVTADAVGSTIVCDHLCGAHVFRRTSLRFRRPITATPQGALTTNAGSPSFRGPIRPARALDPCACLPDRLVRPRDPSCADLRSSPARTCRASQTRKRARRIRSVGRGSTSWCVIATVAGRSPCRRRWDSRRTRILASSPRTTRWPIKPSGSSASSSPRTASRPPRCKPRRPTGSTRATRAGCACGTGCRSGRSAAVPPGVDLALLREAEYFLTPRVAELYRLEELSPPITPALRPDAVIRVLRSQRHLAGAADRERAERYDRGADRIPAYGGPRRGDPAGQRRPVAAPGRRRHRGWVRRERVHIDADHQRAGRLGAQPIGDARRRTPSAPGGPAGRSRGRARIRRSGAGGAPPTCVAQRPAIRRPRVADAVSAASRSSTTHCATRRRR